MLPNERVAYKTLRVWHNRAAYDAELVAHRSKDGLAPTEAKALAQRGYESRYVDADDLLAQLVQLFSECLWKCGLPLMGCTSCL